jgi:hypothetical protein
MNSLLGRMRRCRPLVGLLAIAWLPYVSTYCIDAPVDGGCRLAHPSGNAGSHQGHGPGHHSHHDAPTAHHDGDHDHIPAGTCCELTGKRACTLNSSTQSTPPPGLTFTLPWGMDTHPLAVLPTARPLRQTPASAHGPPLYLRFVTLLI